MFLLIHLRDSVILKNASGHKLKRGDILIRRREPIACASPYCKMKPDGFIMNGDAQTWTEFVLFEQVVAVAHAIERKGRLISCNNRLYRFQRAVDAVVLPPVKTKEYCRQAENNPIQMT